MNRKNTMVGSILLTLGIVVAVAILPDIVHLKIRAMQPRGLNSPWSRRSQLRVLPLIPRCLQIV
jgi:hypothetical protein